MRALRPARLSSALPELFIIKNLISVFVFYGTQIFDFVSTRLLKQSDYRHTYLGYRYSPTF